MAAAQKQHPGWFYRTVLLIATLIWGGNFVVAKGAVEAVGSAWVIGIRFCVAAFVLGICCFGRIRRHLTREALRAGVLIGVFSFLGYWTQFWGLEGTTPAKNAFLSACYCITVPFIWWIVARKRPTAKNLLTACVCVVGISFVTLQGELTPAWGDAVSVLSAFLYGAEIVAIALLLKQNDVFTVTTIQMLVSGVLGCVLGLATTGLPSSETLLSVDFIWRMAYIALLGSCFATTAQNVAQTHVPPNEAGLLFAMESVFGTVFSVLFYGEVLTVKVLVGFALILAAVLASELGVKTEAR